MVKNKVVIKERDAWTDLANFIGEMVAKYAEAMELDQLPNPDCHDRLIVLDYGEETERVYHCGASSKEAGKKLCAIN